MRTVFLAGGIASGKSTVARELESLGAKCIDLDGLSREVLSPGEPCLRAIAQEFGEDLIGERGALDRGLLARRAFATSQKTALLEKIELPYITELLRRRIDEARERGVGVCVVEVPLLDRVEEMLNMADDVLCVTLPLELRRRRALGRGMSEADFMRRYAQQPTDDYLRSHATHEIVNDGSLEKLRSQLTDWWGGLACS